MDPETKKYLDSFLEEFVNYKDDELDYLIQELNKIKDKDPYYISDQIVIDNLLFKYYGEYSYETNELKYTTYGLRWSFDEFKNFYINRYALIYDNDPLYYEKIKMFNWRIPFDKLVKQKHEEFLLNRK